MKSLGEREYYPIIEAANLLNCLPIDLIHHASQAKFALGLLLSNSFIEIEYRYGETVYVDEYGEVPSETDFILHKDGVQGIWNFNGLVRVPESLLVQVESQFYMEATSHKLSEFVGFKDEPSIYTQIFDECPDGLECYVKCYLACAIEFEWKNLFVTSNVISKLKSVQAKFNDLQDENLEFRTFETSSRRGYQFEIILAVISALEYEPLLIPDGGKAKIKKSCLTRKKHFTESAFDHAWKDGVTANLFRMANHKKYTSS